jgi:hypothetical protein
MSRPKRSVDRFADGGLVPASGSPKHPSDEVQRIMAHHQAVVNKVNMSWTSWNLGSISSGPVIRPEFSGSEFSMGTAVGVRSWDVDKLGRLVSPSYHMVWPPAEVGAECRKTEAVQYRVSMTAGGSYTLTSPEAETAEAEEHNQASCSCGFYAYYEGFNDYATDGRITGVIEGYGETQIGTRGFKSAKARIVALYIPAQGANERLIGETKFDRVRTNYGGKVAIFDDYAHMVAEFPTTAPEDAPTPDTDPDFWTRGIA